MRDRNDMSGRLEHELPALKEQLLIMASRAEAAVNRAVKALLKRDDHLARQIKEQDSMIDQLAKKLSTFTKATIFGTLGKLSCRRRHCNETKNPGRG